MSLSRHVRKGVQDGILRHIYVQQLVASNFTKNRESVEGELCLNVTVSFSIIVVCHCVMFQKQYFEQTGMEGHKQTLRGARLSWPPQ